MSCCPCRQATESRSAQALPELHLKKLHARLESAKVRLHIPIEHQGVFEELQRIGTCTWQNGSILYEGEVVIKPPFTPESCSRLNNDGNTAALEYVQSLLSRIGERIGSR